MAQDEIVEKLNSKIVNTSSFDDEALVTYFMVQARKLLEHGHSKSKYPLLNFYCDWVVHTSKDRITNEMKAVFQEIYQSIIPEMHNRFMVQVNSPAIQFVYMEKLKQEMEGFYAEHEIIPDLFDNQNWIPFIQTLVKILENQAIVAPIPEIEKAIFEPAAPGCVILTLVFSEPVNGYPSYTLKNAY